MRAVIDNALPADVFRELGTWPANGALSVHDTMPERAARLIRHHVEAYTPPVVLVGAWFVLTRPEDDGSPPHFDEDGPTAVLHLAALWRAAWGGEFVFLDPHQVVDYRPNRLVVWSEDCQHMHAPPEPHAGLPRMVLVSRYRPARS